MSDNINPEHYKRLPSEAIEIIESAIEKAPAKVEAYLEGQALKYLLRAIREVFLSEEFLTAFAKAWQKTPLVYPEEINTRPTYTNGEIV